MVNFFERGNIISDGRYMTSGNFSIYPIGNVAFDFAPLFHMKFHKFHMNQLPTQETLNNGYIAMFLYNAVDDKNYMGRFEKRPNNRHVFFCRFKLNDDNTMTRLPSYQELFINNNDNNMHLYGIKIIPELFNTRVFDPEPGKIANVYFDISREYIDTYSDDIPFNMGHDDDDDDLSDSLQEITDPNKLIFVVTTISQNYDNDEIDQYNIFEMMRETVDKYHVKVKYIEENIGEYNYQTARVINDQNKKRTTSRPIHNDIEKHIKSFYIPEVGGKKKHTKKKRNSRKKLTKRRKHRYYRKK